MEPAKTRPSARRSASGDSPTPTAVIPRSRAWRTRSAAPSSSTQTTRNPSGEIRSRKSVEGGVVGLLRAPVVEVVGLDVGDDRGVRRVDQERAVALVGLGDEQVAAARRGRWSPDSLSSPPIANDGSAPQCWRATVSIDVVVVLPCVPATATTRRPCHHRLERRRARAAAAAPAGAPRRPRGCSRGWRSTPRRCRRRARARRRGRRRSGRPARAAPRACAESLASQPDTVMPRASMMRAMPDRPAPPMPTKCTRPSSVGAGAARRGRGTITPDRRRRPLRASRSSASRGIRSEPPRPTSSPAALGSPSSAGTVAAHPLGGQRAVVDQQPAARRRPRGGR